MIHWKATLKTRIPQIIATGDKRAELAVSRAANNIVSIAASKSRYKTGNMRAGWQQEEIYGSQGHARRVFNNVHYTIYHEYGTIFMSAQPMITPAIEIVEPEFEREMKSAYV